MEEISSRRIIVDDEKPAPKYEDASAEAFAQAAQPTDDTDPMSLEEDKFIAFVNKQIEKMESHLLFDGKSIPTLGELSSAICQHAHIMLALTSLYETARWELSEAKENYDLWYAQKYMEVRNAVNREDLAKAKWYSSSEIEMMVKSKYRKEIKELKAAVMSADAKKSTLQHLIDGWNNYSFQLQTLSKNAQAEYSSVQREAYEDPSMPNMGY